MSEIKYKYKLPDSIRKKCREPFPGEAMKQHPSKKFLTTIKAQFVIERLNDVFGLAGWNYDHEIVSDTPEYVVMKGCLVFLEYNLSTPYQYGGHKKTGTNTEAADGYKSAVTDGLTKCASIIEIGNDVFKGLVKPPTSGNNSTANKKYTGQDDKPWLNENTPEWKSAIEWLKEGGTIDKIKEKYKINKKNNETLMSAAI